MQAFKLCVQATITARSISCPYLKMKKGAILLVDDDPDDHYIIGEAVKELRLQNPIESFHHGEALIQYLCANLNEQPFIILCDINLPRMDGIAVKKLLNSYPDLKKKCIPWVYYSTSVSHTTLTAAYDLGIQGIFTKKTTMEDVKRSLKLIFDYWSECRHPNN